MAGTPNLRKRSDTHSEMPEPQKLRHIQGPEIVVYTVNQSLGPWHINARPTKMQQRQLAAALNSFQPTSCQHIVLCNFAKIMRQLNPK